MPAKKPLDLINMHLTKAERAQREEQEGTLSQEGIDGQGSFQTDGRDRAGGMARDRQAILIT